MSPSKDHPRPLKLREARGDDVTEEEEEDAAAATTAGEVGCSPLETPMGMMTAEDDDEDDGIDGINAIVGCDSGGGG